IGLLIVLFIVVIGIVFDMLGIASTAAKEAPLNAMAAEKVSGAKQAVILHKNADKFASFCNDVIGDISGIISGSALTIVILEIILLFQMDTNLMQMIFSDGMTSIIAALIVGGKAIGKYYAINHYESILLLTSKVIYFIEEKLKINIISKK